LNWIISTAEPIAVAGAITPVNVVTVEMVVLLLVKAAAEVTAVLVKEGKGVISMVEVFRFRRMRLVTE
jgi:hypothetical protein